MVSTSSKFGAFGPIGNALRSKRWFNWNTGNISGSTSRRVVLFGRYTQYIICQRYKRVDLYCFFRVVCVIFGKYTHGMDWAQVKSIPIMFESSKTIIFGIIAMASKSVPDVQSNFEQP